MKKLTCETQMGLQFAMRPRSPAMLFFFLKQNQNLKWSFNLEAANGIKWVGNCLILYLNFVFEYI